MSTILPHDLKMILSGIMRYFAFELDMQLASN